VRLACSKEMLAQGGSHADGFNETAEWARRVSFGGRRCKNWCDVAREPVELVLELGSGPSRSVVQSSRHGHSHCPLSPYCLQYCMGGGRGGSWAARMHKVRPGERWPSHECGSWIYDSLACRPALCVHVVSPHPFGPSSMRLPMRPILVLSSPR
jgi:hypothetical protein